MPISSGPPESAPQRGLPRNSDPAKLDPDLLAFVEALARYQARKDHEAQSKVRSREPN
jgi:hypothetical protein